MKRYLFILIFFIQEVAAQSLIDSAWIQQTRIGLEMHPSIDVSFTRALGIDTIEQKQNYKIISVSLTDPKDIETFAPSTVKVKGIFFKGASLIFDLMPNRQYTLVLTGQYPSETVLVKNNPAVDPTIKRLISFSALPSLDGKGIVFDYDLNVLNQPLDEKTLFALSSSGLFSTSSVQNPGNISIDAALCYNLRNMDAYMPLSMQISLQTNDNTSVSSLVYAAGVEGPLDFFPFKSLAEIVCALNSGLAGSKVFVPFIRARLAIDYSHDIKTLMIDETRFEGTAKWSIPILDNQTYFNMKATGYYVLQTAQKEGFITSEFEYRSNSKFSVLVKYLNGSLPPTFIKTQAVMTGINLILDGLVTLGTKNP